MPKWIKAIMLLIVTGHIISYSIMAKNLVKGIFAGTLAATPKLITIWIIYYAIVSIVEHVIQKNKESQSAETYFNEVEKDFWEHENNKEP